jgi:hypothetical protein
LANVAPADRTVVMLVRPDRYVAVAAIAEQEASFPMRVANLIANTWPHSVDERTPARAAPAHI